MSRIDFDNTIAKLQLDTNRSVRCPRCGARAIYDTPFEFYSKSKPRPEIQDRPLHYVNQWIVGEKYPSVLPWTPANGKCSSQQQTGVIKCTGCYLVAAYDLDWPNDAFYQWDIK